MEITNLIETLQKVHVQFLCPQKLQDQEEDLTTALN